INVWSDSHDPSSGSLGLVVSDRVNRMATWQLVDFVQGSPRSLGGCTMSDEFDQPRGDDPEGRGWESVLNRCRALATKIANELRNKGPEHFSDKLSLADVHASPDRTAWILEQIIHTPTSTAKGLQEGSRQRHR